MLPTTKEKRRYYLFYIFITLIIAFGGIVSAVFIYEKIDVAQRAHMLDRINTVAKILPASEIKNLLANEADLSNPSYINLKNIFLNVRSVNKDIRFIYLIGQTNSEKMFFYLDSEDPDSEDYSPPGQSYPEASEDMHLTIQDGISRSEGPSSDRWGTWFSAYTPVLDENGKIIALLGMDTPAKEYVLNNTAYASIPILISIMILIILFFIKYVRARELNYLRLKEEFISVASHEIRTPIVGIRWALEDIFGRDNTVIDTQSKATLEVIYKNCLNLIKETNDLLSSNEPKRSLEKKMQKETIGLKKFFEDIKENLSLSAKEHRVNIVVDYNFTEEDFVVADSKNLRHILSNLIVNAIKYSKPDSDVRISYAKDKKWHIFKVADHGPGITTENIKRMFGGYFRTESAMKSNEVGTGLGLFLIKKIVESMKGDVAVESEVGKGSIFTIKIPVVT